MTDLAPGKPFRMTGRGVLIGFVAFFTVVVGFDVTVSTLAYRTFSGEVADDPYEAGILFNQTLAKREAQTRLGWSAKLQATPGSGLVITLADRDGRPLDGLDLSGRVTRPATETGRRSLDFTAMGRGAYRTGVGGLHGAWDLTATAKARDGASFDLQTRITLP